DALFATLDPTTRRTTTQDGRVYTLTDTVGFVRHLPHDLVEAFKSTLEETAGADVLVHLVDASDPDPVGQIIAVRDVLRSLQDKPQSSEISQVPEILVFNKIDLIDEVTLAGLRASRPRARFISTRTGEGVDELISQIEQALPTPQERVDVVIPYSRGDLVDQIHKHGTIHELEHGVQGTHVIADLHPGLAAEVRAVGGR
ncbi:MAG: 50S ribosome-binding GTPase, partial [Cutibacterium granulosum]|nr:50S ribosome-binding GTPase [Cutibacterium granulosum]